MSKVDYVRFLPITQSEVVAQKVNYRQEKTLETQLRSIEKAEKYSKSLLEKRNHTVKQSMATRIQRNSLQGCLKYSNSEKDGETYVTLNRTSRHSVDDAKLRQLMPRLTMMCDPKTRVQSSNQGNHRRLTRSSSDSSASYHHPSVAQLPKSLSLDCTDSNGNRRRRSASLACHNGGARLNSGTRIAWEATGALDNLHKPSIKIEEPLPKLTAVPTRPKQQLEASLPSTPRQHLQLRRSRSLPNTSIFSTSPSRSKLTSLIEVNPHDEDDVKKDNNNNNNYNNNFDASSNETKNIRDSVWNNGNTASSNKSSAEDITTISDKLVVPSSRRLKCKPAWYEAEDTTSMIGVRPPSDGRPLRYTKSIE